MRTDPDAIPSDRLQDVRDDAQDMETIRQHYALMVRDRNAVLHYLNTHGQRQLAGRYKRFCDWFEEHAVDWSHKVPPKQPVNMLDDPEAELECRKLYGTEAEWLEDLRRDGKLYPFPWEV